MPTDEHGFDVPPAEAVATVSAEGAQTGKFITPQPVVERKAKPVAHEEIVDVLPAGLKESIKLLQKISDKPLRTKAYVERLRRIRKHTHTLQQTQKAPEVGNSPMFDESKRARRLMPRALMP